LPKQNSLHFFSFFSVIDFLVHKTKTMITNLLKYLFAFVVLSLALGFITYLVVSELNPKAPLAKVTSNNFQFNNKEFQEAISKKFQQEIDSKNEEKSKLLTKIRNIKRERDNLKRKAKTESQESQISHPSLPPQRTTGDDQRPPGNNSSKKRIITNSDTQLKNLDTYKERKVKKSNLIDEEIEEIEERKAVAISNTSQAEKGKIVYYVPDSMIVNQVYHVAVSVSNIRQSNNKSLTAFITQNISNSGKGTKSSSFIKDTLKVGKIITARILASEKEKFEITQIGKEEQHLTEFNEYTAFWKWAITPLKQGTSTLNFTIDAITKKDGERGSSLIGTKHEDILVVSYTDPIKYAYLSSGFVFLFCLTGFFVKTKRDKIMEQKLQFLSPEFVTLARNEIGKGELKNGINLIKDNGQDLSNDLSNQLITHLSELEEVNRKSNLGILGLDDRTKTVNRIRFSILDILSNLEKKNEIT